MPRFLVLVKYTAGAFEQLVRKPEDRLLAVRPVAQRCGGVIVRKDFVAGGDFDLAAELDLPDIKCATAFYMAVMAGGAVSAMKIWPLLSIQEGVRAMRMAGEAKYLFPGSVRGAARARGRRRARGRA
jgi:uncharacterized protein with GYD domain